jgi:aspartate-semialdehyde dehydrogenase
MASAGVRIGVIGATGALGSEVLAVLEASPLRVRAILPVATDRAIGREVEFRGEVYPVETQVPSVRGLDLILLCAPAGASLDFAHEALRAQVPCIDLSGALSSSDEVPLRLSGYAAPPEAEGAPVVAMPTGPALAWALVLRPLDEIAGLRRVVGTALEAASTGGRPGIEALYAESLALFNQQEAPEPEVFRRPVAFDCMPAVGELEADGESSREAALAAELGRLLDSPVKLGAAVVQVPIFVGHGATLAVETERPLEPKEAEAQLSKAPGVELWQEDAEGPTTRATAGRDVVLVGRVRRDPSTENGLLLWLVADLLRLAAANAVQLAVARLRAH